MVMELQVIMDTGTENLWLSNSLSPTSYHQLSHNTDNNVLRQQASLGYHPISQDALYWQEQDVSPKSSPDASRSPLNYNNHQSPENNKYQSNNNLKRRSNEHYHHQQQHVQPEKKIPRRIGPAANDVSSQGWSAQVEEIAEQFATEFDGSLSALAANDLATAVASYNMSEALLSLPSLTVFKQEAPSPDNQQNITILNHASQNNLQNGNNENNNNNKNNNSNISNSANLHQIYTSADDFQTNHTTNNQVSSTQHGIDSNDDCRFQYILGAATSIATKVNEETLTYLNQGQSYEIKLKKLGDVSNYRGTLLKSTIRIRFHERRLQYMEREQILSWLKARPGERLLEVDVPLSYGMVDVRQPSPYNNSVEFMWDPTKEIGVYVKINCISTEFTPKKHGGEKGVPFRIEVETTHGDGQRLHIGSCQIKVFKLKGADRKHKQDRDKLQRRPSHERDKYQPSYDCTVFVDIPMESLSPQITYPQDNRNAYSPSIINSSDNCPSPIITDDNNRASSNVSSPLPTTTEKVEQIELTSTSSPSQTLAWLRSNRFSSFESVFSSYSASDILRLSRDDVIEICGLADGIRLYNLLHTKAQLTLYFTCDNQREGGLWQPVYLDNLTSQSLSFKIQNALRLPNDKLYLLTLQGPQGIHVIVNDDVVANMKDNSMFVTEVTKDPGSDCYKLLLKPSFNN